MRDLVLHLIAALFLCASTIYLSFHVLNDVLSEQEFYANVLKLSDEIGASKFRSQWIQPDVEESMIVHLFEQLNDDLSDSVKPVGPFRFRVNQHKVIIEETDDELTYQPYVSYYYNQSDHDNVNLTQKVRLANVPMVAAETILRSKLNSTNPDVAEWVMKLFHTISSARSVVEHEAQELIFNGYTDSLIKLIEGLQNVKLIDEQIITDGKFSLLFNDTDSEGLLTVDKGMSDVKKTGQVIAWNHLHQTTFYPPGSSCNKIRGSNGQNFGAFIDEDKYLYMMIPEFCGPVPFKFTRETTNLGLSTSRFEFDFESDHHDSCFITNGIHDVSKCNHLAPIALTSAKPFNSTTGEKSYVEVEPTTGVTLKASINFQVNLIANGSLIPLMRIQRDAQAMESAVMNVKMLKLSHMSLYILAWLLCLIISIGTVLLVIYSAFNCIRRERSDDRSSLLPSNDESS